MLTDKAHIARQAHSLNALGGRPGNGGQSDVLVSRQLGTQSSSSGLGTTAILDTLIEAGWIASR